MRRWTVGGIGVVIRQIGQLGWCVGFWLPAIRGYTLVEMMVSIAVTSIVMVGMGTVVMVASQALPNGARLATSINQAGEVANRLTEELQQARHITERTVTSIAFTVADRDGDGSPERIRYAWSGKAGDPLTRQYNFGTDVNVLADVYQFDLDYDLKSTVESFPGLPAEGAEILVSSYTAASDLKTKDITGSGWWGQYVQPSLALFLPDTVSWRVTRVRFEAIANDTSYEDTYVQLRLPDAQGLPTSTVLEQQVMSEAALADLWVWEEFTFNTDHALSPGADLCIVLQGTSGTSAQIRIEADNAFGATGMLKSTDTGSSWSLKSARAMRHEIYGKLTAPGPDQAVTRQYVTGIGVLLQSGTDANTRLDTAVVLPNAPEVLTAVWELDFDTDPTKLDMNGDNVIDWSDYGGGFDPADLGKGMWYAPNDGSASGIYSISGETFNEVTTVDLSYRATSAGGYGAVFWLNADYRGSKHAPIHADLFKPNATSQELWIGYELEKYTIAYPVLDEFVNVRMVINPGAKTNAVFIDGVHKLTYPYNWGYSGASAGAWLFTDGCSAEFDYVSVRVGGF